MKKIFALLLAVLLVASVFTACGNKPAEDAGNQEPPVQKDALEGTVSEIIAGIVEKAPVEFMAGEMPVDLTDTSEDGLAALEYMTGLKSAEKISEASVYEAMTGSQAFSMVVVRVKDAANTEAVAKEMKENIDTRKWICVEADELMVAGYVDVVMLIMVDTGLGLKAQTFVDAFKTVCPAELDFAN